MSGFTDVFGGSAILPSDVAYNLLTGYSSPLQLQWPSLATDLDIVAARILEVATAGTIKLPNATLVSTGQDHLFRNTSGGSVAVQTFTGGSLLTLSSGEVKYAYLTDNSTTGGTWTVVAFGASTGTLDASQLAGFGLTVIGATLNTAHPVTVSATSFTIQTSDRARLYNFTGGAHTLSLSTASGYGNNFFFLVSNNGSGAVTIDPAGVDTIDGSSTIDINPGESAFVITDGSNWFTVGRGRSVSFNFTQLVKDVSGNTDVTLTTTEASNKVLKFIGTLTGNINVIVPNVVSLYIVDNQTAGAFTLTLKTAAGTGIAVPQSNRNILYSDGTNVLQAVTVSVASTTFGDGSAASPSITFGSDTDTGFYRVGPNNIGVTTGGVKRVDISDTAFNTTVQLVSTLATGTPPFSVASTTNVPNLNASSLNGATFAAPGPIGGGTPGSGAFTTISASGVITSTLATGTAPFTVASTTNVPNLNASSLNGATFASPGNIGDTTPGNGTFVGGSFSAQLSVPDGSAPAPGLRFASSGVTGLFSASDNTVRIACNSTEIAKFDSDSLDIGGGSLTGRLNVSSPGASVNPVQINNTDAGASSQVSINFLRNGASVGSITTTNVATAYNTTSDYRLKFIVGSILNPARRLKMLRPLTYRFKADNQLRDCEGFLAHELQEILPFAVTGKKDNIDATGEPIYQQVDYSKITPLLVAALQEALIRIEKLEERLGE